MADPLSIAASIAGLITLTTAVIEGTYKTISCCRNVDKDAQRLLSEVQSLLGVLTSLRLLAKRVNANHLLSEIPSREIQRCQLTLEQLHDKLAKADPTAASTSYRKWGRMMKWPLTSHETDKLLQQVATHKATFDLTTSMDTLNAVLTMSARQNSISNEIDDIKQLLYRIDMTPKRKETLEFFGAFDSEQIHEMNISLHHPGTGLWFTECESFKSWLAHRNARLWLHGIPGAGKSVLAALVIKKVVQSVTSGTAAIFYYIDYKNAKTLEPDAILASLCGQLARQHEYCFDMVNKLHRPDPDNVGRHSRPSLQELKSLLFRMSSVFDEVSIVVDALDECKQPRQTSKLLADLATKQSSNIKVILVSREDPQIETHLGSFDKVSISAQSSDLRLFVSAQIQERTEDSRWRIRSTELEAEIIRRLVHGSEGMFRWVVCQLDHLSELPSDAARRKALDLLPPDLETTYERILLRIDKKVEPIRLLVERVLTWLCDDVAEGGDLHFTHLDRLPRPLLAVELCEAVSINANDESINDESRNDIDTILYQCSSLVRLSSDGLRIEFAHFSVKEYLESDDRASRHPQLRRYMPSLATSRQCKTATCLTYLNMTHFEGGAVQGVSQWFSRAREYPLYAFASTYWHLFSPEEEFSELTLKLIDQLFDTRHRKSLRAWAQAFFIARRGYLAVFPVDESDIRKEALKAFDFVRSLSNGNALQLACILGLPRLVRRLPGAVSGVVEQSILGSPLHCAMLVPDVVQYLMSVHGFLDEWSTGYMFRDLLGGWISGSPQVVQALLDRDVDCGAMVKYRGGARRSSLWLAVLTRTEQPMLTAGLVMDKHTVEDLLVDTAGDYRELFQDCSNVLQDINLSTKARLILLRLELPSDVSTKIYTSQGDQVIEPSLLRTKQEEHMRDACSGNILAWVRALHQEQGLDINDCKDPQTGDSPLTRAAGANAADVVEYLLAHGANVQHTTFAKDTALHCLLANDVPNVDLIVKLVEGGCLIDARNRDGRTALMLSAADGDDRNVKILLQNGANLEDKNNLGKSVWHIVAEENKHATYKLLREHTTVSDLEHSLRRVDSTGLTPLNTAVKYGSIEMTKALQSDGASFAVNQNTGKSLLHYVAAGVFKSAAFLDYVHTEAGLHCPTSVDNDGLTSLHDLVDSFLARLFDLRLRDQDAADAAWSDSTNVFAVALDAFCSAGVNINSRSVHGETALHLFLRGENERMLFIDLECADHIQVGLETLLGKGADPLVVNNEGQACLDLLLLNMKKELAFRNPDSPRGKGYYSYYSNLALATFRSMEDKALVNHRINGKLLLSWLADAQLDKVDEVLLYLFRRETHVERYPSIETSTLDLLCKEGCSQHLIESVLALFDEAGKQLQEVTLLHAACKATNAPELLLVLINRGVHVNALGKDKETALHVAARRNVVDALKFLLDHGADVALEDRYGWTALAWACHSGSLEVASLLMDEKSAPDSTPQKRYGLHRGVDTASRASLSLFELACMGGNIMLIEAMLARFGRREHLSDSLALWSACMFSRVDLVRWLLDAGFNKEVAEVTTGSRALHIAAEEGCGEITKMLIDAGCNVHAKDYKNQSPFMVAFEAETDTAVFLEHGAEVAERGTDNEGETPATGNEQRLKILSTSESDFLRARISKVDITAIESFVHGGGELNSVFASCRTCTPLLHALQKGPKICRYFLSKSLSAAGSMCKEHSSGDHHVGWTALHFAAANLKDGPITSRMLNESNAWIEDTLTPLHAAARNNNKYAVDFFLEYGIDVDVAGQELQTPLHEAIASRSWHKLGDDVELVQLLLKWGANPNARDSIFTTPLMYAADCGELAVLRVLLAHGADRGSRDFYGQTALHFAATKGHFDCMVLLQRSPADVQQKDNYVCSVFCRLVHAVAEDSSRCSVAALLGVDYPMTSQRAIQAALSNATVLRLLLARYPRWAKLRDVNALDTSRSFAPGNELYCAAANPRQRAIELLVGSGALLNLEGGFEGTALMIAAATGRLDNVKLLVRLGAVTTYKKHGKTINAFDKAKHFPKIQQWLLVGRFNEQRRLPCSQCDPSPETVRAPRLRLPLNLDVVFAENWEEYFEQNFAPREKRKFVCELTEHGSQVQEVVLSS